MASRTSATSLTIIRRSRIYQSTQVSANNAIPIVPRNGNHIEDRRFHHFSVVNSGPVSSTSYVYSPMVFTRYLSTTSEHKTTPQEDATKDDESTSREAGATEETPPEPKVEPTAEEKLQAEVKDLKDKLLRSYAEQENIRRIAKNDVESARNFAVSSFAKSLLDTSDNLSRAMDAVPEEYRNDKENHAVLATLYEGIKMTDDGLNKAFEKNGLQKFGNVGDKFDPNLHEALFEYPDEKMEPGTLGQVMKVGFTLKGRTIRSAEVGIIKKA